MERRLKDSLIKGYPSTARSDVINMPHAVAEVFALIGNVNIPNGDQQPSSWKRMIGGRKRYNHQRQQIAKARREAIMCWLMDNRTFYWSEWFTKPIRMGHITIRHGDGAMFARALNVGKATICRDLSCLQACYPWCFGKRNVGISYDEYMNFWRYASRTHMGEEQPFHNLRFRRNQRGPKARQIRKTAKMMGFVADNRRVSAHRSSTSSTTADQVDAPADHTLQDAMPTTEDFIKILEANCPPDAPPKWFVRRQRRVSKKGTA